MSWRPYTSVMSALADELSEGLAGRRPGEISYCSDAFVAPRAEWARRSILGDVDGNEALPAFSSLARSKPCPA